MDPLHGKLLASRAQTYGAGLSEATYINPSISWHERHVLSFATPGVVELANLYSVSLQLEEAFVNVVRLLEHGNVNTSIAVGRPTEHVTSSLRDILLCDFVSDIESRMAYTLLALCFQVEQTFRPLTESVTSTSSSLLGNGARQDAQTMDVVAQAYLNKKRLSNDCSRLERQCWLWCALVLGSILLSFDLTASNPSQQLHRSGEDHILIQRLHAKGHIILVAASQYLVPASAQDPIPEPQTPDPRAWLAVNAEYLAGQFFGTPAMLHEWQVQWEATMKRQHEWEVHGHLTVCAPQRAVPDEQVDGVDVEYMVLREGRESLPVI
jgi:hypothetical protein